VRRGSFETLLKVADAVLEGRLENVGKGREGNASEVREREAQGKRTTGVLPDK
jgi:hypothetical protein